MHTTQILGCRVIVCQLTQKYKLDKLQIQICYLVGSGALTSTCPQMTISSSIMD